jgi:hypothetical protein
MHQLACQWHTRRAPPVSFSFVWDGARIYMATGEDYPAARNVVRTGMARVARGA